jgi:hypothetical protein
MTHKRLIAACLFSLCSLGAIAQIMPPPQNVLQLSATGTVEVQQDLLSLTSPPPAKAPMRPLCRASSRRRSTRP